MCIFQNVVPDTMTNGTTTSSAKSVQPKNVTCSCASQFQNRKCLLNGKWDTLKWNIAKPKIQDAIFCRELNKVTIVSENVLITLFCRFIAVALNFESSISVMYTQIGFQVAETGFFPSAAQPFLSLSLPLFIFLFRLLDFVCVFHSDIISNVFHAVFILHLDTFLQHFASFSARSFRWFHFIGWFWFLFTLRLSQINNIITAEIVITRHIYTANSIACNFNRITHTHHVAW